MAEKVSVSSPSQGADKAPILTETRPWWPLHSLRGEVDRLFDDFMSSWPFSTRTTAAQPWARLPAAFRPAMPATDIAENGKAFVITMDLPGVDEKNIDVNVTDDVLTVRAEATAERKEEKENCFLSERQHGEFQRAFQIPSGVDSARIGASYEKGVLIITLPKTAEAQQKQRKIRVETH